MYILTITHKKKLSDGRILTIPMGTEVVPHSDKLLWQKDHTGTLKAQYFLPNSSVECFIKDPIAWQGAKEMWFNSFDVKRVKKNFQFTEADRLYKAGCYRIR